MLRVLLTAHKKSCTLSLCVYKCFKKKHTMPKRNSPQLLGVCPLKPLHLFRPSASVLSSSHFSLKLFAQVKEKREASCSQYTLSCHRVPSLQQGGVQQRASQPSRKKQGYRSQHIDTQSLTLLRALSPLCL